MGYIQYNYLKQNYPNKTEVDKQVDTLNTKITENKTSIEDIKKQIESSNDTINPEDLANLTPEQWDKLRTVKLFFNDETKELELTWDEDLIRMSKDPDSLVTVYVLMSVLNNLRFYVQGIFGNDIRQNRVFDDYPDNNNGVCYYIKTPDGSTVMLNQTTLYNSSDGLFKESVPYSNILGLRKARLHRVSNSITLEPFSIIEDQSLVDNINLHTLIKDLLNLCLSLEGGSDETSIIYKIEMGRDTAAISDFRIYTSDGYCYKLSEFTILSIFISGTINETLNKFMIEPACVWSGTEDEFNAIEIKDYNTLYCIPE